MPAEGFHHVWPSPGGLKQELSAGMMALLYHEHVGSLYIPKYKETTHPFTCIFERGGVVHSPVRVGRTRIPVLFTRLQ